MTDPFAIAKHLGREITESLDPTKASGRVRTFADMTDSERSALRAKYERR